jgi:cytochrome c oxidase subunit II
MIGRRMRRFLFAVTLVPKLGNADTPPQHKIIIPPELYELHKLSFVIACVIFVVVFSATIYSIFRHRSTSGRQAEQFHQNVMIEIAWTVIPFLILVATAWPATQSLLAR